MLCPYGVRILWTAALGGLLSFLGGQRSLPDLQAAVEFRSNFVLTPGKADSRFRTAKEFVNDLQLIAPAKRGGFRAAAQPGQISGRPV